MQQKRIIVTIAITEDQFKKAVRVAREKEVSVSKLFRSMINKLPDTLKKRKEGKDVH